MGKKNRRRKAVANNTTRRDGKHETQPQKQEGKQAEMSENDKMIECALETFSKAVQDGVPLAQESLPQNIGQINSTMFIIFFDHSLPGMVDLEMVMNFIGKPSDGQLVLHRFPNFLLSPYPRYKQGVESQIKEFYNMGSAEKICKALAHAREGTIAFLQKEQGIFKMFWERRTKTGQQPLMIGHSKPNLLGTEGTTRLISSSTVQKELFRECDGGYVTVFDHHSFNKVDVDPCAHSGYVNWLVSEVLPTLSRSDGSDQNGNLRKYHRVLQWEIQLIQSIKITPELNASLEISASFDISGWIDGFIASDLKILSDCPGVDADRRLLRLIIFVLLTRKVVMSSLPSRREGSSNEHAESILQQGTVVRDSQEIVGGTNPLEQGHQDQNTTAAGPKATATAADELQQVSEKLDSLGIADSSLGKEDAFTSHKPSEEFPVKSEMKLQQGNKVFLVNIENDANEANPILQNGMEGRIIGNFEDKFTVKFPNLEKTYTLPSKQLHLSVKIPKDRICHYCEKQGGLRCRGCNVTWYCGKECQRQDWKRRGHKQYCKFLASGASFSSLFEPHFEKKA